MPDERLAGGMLHEGVAAPARVLRPAAALGHGMHAVAEQPAQVPHPLVEEATGRIRVVAVRKQQRMAAPDAGVFGVAVAFGHALVGMAYKEAAERVAHAYHRAVITQHRTAAARAGALAAPEHLVLHRVSPEPARESRQHELCPPDRKVQKAVTPAHGIGPAVLLISRAWKMHREKAENPTNGQAQQHADTNETRH
jgi:hypothetical protein